MITSSPTTAETVGPAVLATAARLLRAEVEGAEAIGGGRNSRVYRVLTAGQKVAVLKCYFPRADNRNCLAREFAALAFLRQQGVRNVPEPIAADEAAGCAAYEFIDGVKLAGSELPEGSMEAAAAFLGRLKELARLPAGESLPVAADACFSVAATVRYLQARWGRFQPRAAEDGDDADFRRFLSAEFAPAMEEMVAAACRGNDPETDLPRDDQTLSPSDFGFHNALLRGGREWVFLDFEYFGWDDPAKTLADFLLHPGMDLGETHRMRFARSFRASVAGGAGFAARLRRVYPLYGLVWCLILLNEFLPEHLLRRQFASSQPRDRRVVQAEQMAKARRMLARVRREYEAFPYLD